MKLPDHDTMVSNILAVYGRRTAQQAAAGREWYPLAGKVVTAIAETTDTGEGQVALALAALSPRNPWRWNVADCYSYAVAAKAGGPMPSATTFKRNQLNAWRALAGNEAPWLSAAPKVKAFVEAVLGNSKAIVVDIWAYRVAIGASPEGGKRAGSFKGATYAAIAVAYADAAHKAGVEPTTIQAITWIVAQAEGLQSNRRGRHDLSFKAGTPEFVKALLA